MHYFKVISGKKLLAGAALAVGVCAAAYAILGKGGVISASAAKRDLPIYCVDREEKVCSLTFDAAWGNDTLRKNNKEKKFYLN